MRRLAIVTLAVALLCGATPASADPPQPLRNVADTLDAVDDFVHALCAVDLCLPPWYHADPGPYCVAIAALAPGVPGVVDIGWDGDVSIAGRQVTDCYPFGGGTGFDLSDTYTAVVQFVVDVLNAFCEVDLCIPPGNPGIYCPIFALLSPGVPGVVDIDTEGDVHVFGDRLYDCPPYDV